MASHLAGSWRIIRRKNDDPRRHLTVASNRRIMHKQTSSASMTLCNRSEARHSTRHLLLTGIVCLLRAPLPTLGAHRRRGNPTFWLKSAGCLFAAFFGAAASACRRDINSDSKEGAAVIVPPVIIGAFISHLLSEFAQDYMSPPHHLFRAHARRSGASSSFCSLKCLPVIQRPSMATGVGCIGNRRKIRRRRT